MGNDKALGGILTLFSRLICKYLAKHVSISFFLLIFAFEYQIKP